MYGFWLFCFCQFYDQLFIFKLEGSSNSVIDTIVENRLVKYYLEYTQDFPLIKLDENDNVKIYAIKYGPISYVGKPEFVYPLCFNLNELTDENITIDYSGKQRRPVKIYRNLLNRIKGLNN